MSSYELEGTVKAVFDTQEFASGFSKREFVITTDGEYPQDIKFEVYKDKCEDLDALTDGIKVNVFFNLKGNEYNGNYYNNLHCWRFEAAKKTAASAEINIDEEDDIPFN